MSDQGYYDTDLKIEKAEGVLRELQIAELTLFKKFDAFCAENNIPYFALGGTLLGAVRHKGFIPWDDDMDVGIPREDFNRFLDLCDTVDIHFKLHSYKKDHSYPRYFPRIEEPSISLKRDISLNAVIEPAWIDIFPLDGMPNNIIMRLIWKYHILWLRAKFRLSVFSTGIDLNRKGRPFYEKALIMLGRILPTEKIFNTYKSLECIDRALKKFPYAKSNYLVNAMGAWKFKEMFHKKYYGEGAWYDFEDTKIRGPVDYDYVLTQLYGDYMTPPPEDERNHHGIAEIIRSDEEGDIQ